MKEDSADLRALVLVPIALIVVLLAAAIFGGWWVLHRGLPRRDGSVDLAVLSAPVDVRWDEWGVPHLKGASGRDLAAVQGYLHANDRMMQMELGRRMVAGRLAEVAGEAAIASDIRMRTLRLRRTAELWWDSSGPEARQWLEAYAAGVNAWLEERGADLPPGLGILRIEPEPWTPVDSLGFTLLMAYDLSFWQGHPEEYRYDWLRRHGTEGVRDLVGDEDLHLPAAIVEMAARETRGPEVSPAEDVESNPARSQDAVDGPPGSNSWALGLSRSVEGKMLVANDPHLGYRLPGVWYEVQMRAPDYEVMGMSLPGLPGVVIGQSRWLGWALTNVMLDDHDIFFEEIDGQGETVRRGEVWTPLTISEEEIPVRDGASRTLRLAETDRGPLLPADEERGLPPRSLVWTAYQPADPLTAFLGLARATTVDEVPAAIAGFVAPAQNLVVADIDGGLFQTILGELPQRRLGDGRLPAPGWDAAYGWDGLAPAAAKPQRLRPESDLLVTANSDPRPEGYDGPLVGDFDLPSRTDRIRLLLEERERWRASELAKVQTDILSLYAHRLVELIDDEYKGAAERAYLALHEWDGRFHTAGPAALFALFERDLVERIFADDVDLSAVSWLTLRHWLTRVLDGEMEAGWFDNADTGRREGHYEIVVAALEFAWAEGERRWGDDVALWSYGELHPFELRHPLAALPLLGRVFNRGPVPEAGSSSTVMVAGGSWRGDRRPVSHGPSMRWISVVGDADQSLSILPGGQSGHPFDPHYDDQLELFLEGRLRSLSWREPTIADGTVGEMRFNP